MKKMMIVLMMLMGIGWQSLDAAVDIKNLWHPKGMSRKTIKNLWKKSRSTSAKKNQQSTLIRIRDSQTTLAKTLEQREQKDQQLEKIARSIRRAELESIAISKVLDRLEKEQKKSEKIYQNAKKSIDQYGGKIQKLDATIKGHQGRLIHLLSDQFALISALQTIGRPTINSVVQEEAYRAYKKKNNQELAKLKTEIDGNKRAKAKLLTQQNVIKKSIRALIVKRDLYQKKKEEKTKLLAHLAQEEEAYRAQLKAIMQRQDFLRQTLAKLNIVRKEEMREAQRAEQARRAELKRKTAQLKRLRQKQAQEVKQAKAEGRAIHYVTPHISAPTATGSVKQYGSSYQTNNILAYRGSRTISPLAHARVVKKFGTYVDPIYKIKIFNDNIVLKASKTGAKVRNVLNGKVVYVGKNSMLGKVVIVEHSNRIHTIYAALDRISPMLRNGSRVKKGTIVGRVKRKLIFQATQNSKYINPLRLIRL
jgi:murein DD-endopeptidase MepM/ murein hydrolase activator NlpD